MSEPILQMTGVCKSFGFKTVLREVQLSVPAGSVLGLLGKNGSGKTTLLKCALGLLRPQHGEITLMGEPAWSLSANAKAQLGYVPQEISLYPWMKVRQMVAYIAAFYPHWHHGLVKHLLKEWELHHDDRVGKLSAGQLQKLAIIVALGHEPKVIILDEPAATLDPISRRDFLSTLLDLIADGQRTVVFSSHITSDLERVANRVAILRRGKIVYHDEMDALKDGVKRLRVSTQAPLPEDGFNIPGLLRYQGNSHEALLTVASYTDELPRMLEAQWSATVQVEDLNLEEIFLEMHHG